MTTLNVTDLNFDTIKANLKTWMQSQPDFTDYKFEASGLSFLLDVLAYNTHYNAVLANFAANEMFLDTALKRMSVVSHAKSLGYHPRGARGARANVKITATDITGTLRPQMIMPRGTRFTTTKNNSIYSFVTSMDYAAPLQNNVDGNNNEGYHFPDVELIEGTYYTYTYPATGNYTTKYQIPNTGIDISTIVMRVYKQGTNSNPDYYYHSSTLIDVTEQDKVFFTQENDGQTVEFYFGNGTSVGKLPDINDVIQIEYIATNGSQGNDISKFFLAGTLNSDGMVVDSTKVTVELLVANTSSVGGIDAESIEEIKYNASKHFTVQNRAVTAFDYKSIISQNFFNIESIKVWGGEDNIPIQYNTVYVCIKPALHDFLTEKEKTQIREIVASKSVMNMRLIFVDPEYLNLQINSNVYYSSTAIPRSTDLTGLIRPAIINYSDTQLEAFSESFMYSKFVAMIDNVHPAINHNNTEVSIYKSIPVELNRTRLYNVNFGNSILTQDKSVYSDEFFIAMGINLVKVFVTNLGGRMVLGYYSSNSDQFITIQDVGTVDYQTGLVSLTPLTVVKYVNAANMVRLFMKPQKNDIQAAQNNIIRILSPDININTYIE